ncbi:DUF4169 family protein [Chelativorans sp. M5D2P16]|uniref:DUF4169 family protein n=1 Tax=Chelativorans sp. M5D2P16 TaxID=3095678 RepID=UPI002AC9FF9B|nr:DUF4169 family protein [Chelativorans sp. M5D2P16]MDZ5698192.1 DUF4169 family protein [Chelativorans sp. M5D2P16]
MAEIVNLRMKRKEKARADKRRRAEENRQRHGQSAAEREAACRRAENAARELEGHRRVPDRDEGQ